MKNANNITLGYIYALQAFLAWGFLPFFWKSLLHVDALEILAHRIIWSFGFLLLLLFIGKQKNTWKLLRERRTRNNLLCTSLLIGANWGTFIYAVNSNQIVEASLGYYINPIINVFLGMVILKEKLDKLKIAALIIASISVAYLTIDYGQFPWIAIFLASSFGFYGLLKKTAKIDAIPALTIETLFLTPVALGYVIFLLYNHTGSFAATTPSTNILLILTGVATTLPLYWFAKGAHRIPLSSIGFLQYIGPTLMLLIGIFAYNETFKSEQILAFSLIWIALFIYSISLIRNARRQKKARNSLISA